MTSEQIRKEIQQSEWHKQHWKNVSVGLSKTTGELQYIHYDGTPYLEVKDIRVFGRISDKLSVEEYADRYERIINEIQGLIDSINEDNIWEPDDGDIPEVITYEFSYPAGKAGDIDYYIATEYGTVEKIDALNCRMKMSTKYKEQLAQLMFWYVNDVYGSNFEEKPYYELSSFLTTYNRAHKLRRLCDIFARLGPFQNHPLRCKGREMAENYIITIRKKRQDIYSYLIKQNRTSGKWVSEQQMFAVIKDEYPNAIYQFNADWLGMQSIDVYIPEIKIGFEYQGIQHYEPVDLFGGEEGLQDCRRRDEEKKEKCKANGVRLIEWKYDVPINKDNLASLMVGPV